MIVVYQMLKNEDHAHVKDVRPETVVSYELPVRSRGGIQKPFPGPVSSLVPHHSCIRTWSSDTAVVSETVPDDGSVDFLRATGYGSYPIVSRLVTTTRIVYF